MRNLLSSAAAILLTLAPVSLSQPTANDEPNVAYFQAAQQLGRRVAIVSHNFPTAPVLLIAPDTQTYLHAISTWSTEARYPVLIDDNTPQAAENIARFANAFKPQQTLRLAPVTTPITEQSLQTAIARAWSSTNAPLDTPKDALAQLEFIAPGIVITSLEDPAWTGALALAAYRGQHLAFAALPEGRTRETLTPQQLSSLQAVTTNALNKTNSQWQSLNDPIDAITLAYNGPQLAKSAKETLAVSDIIGRHKSNKRFAWTGILSGNHQSAAYRAMAAIFIQPRSAWLFDGYESSFAPQYKVTEAAAQLNNANFSTQTDNAAQSRDTWNSRTHQGLEATLIHIQTHGQPHFFHIQKQRIYTDAIPVLTKPAAIHFIHSFSAKRTDDQETIAARWLDEGAHFYLGSVDEPFLPAFIPPQVFVSRAISAFPLGAAVRWEQGRFADQPWKLNVLGDPLITIFNTPKTNAQIPNQQQLQTTTTNLEDQMKAALTQRNLNAALTALVMLARYDDAHRLATAFFNDEQANQTPKAATLALTLASLNQDHSLALKAFTALPPQQQRVTRNRNRVWSTLNPQALRDITNEQLTALATNTSRFNKVQEAKTLSIPAQRLGGEKRVQDIFRIITKNTNDNLTSKIKAAMGL